MPTRLSKLSHLFRNLRYLMLSRRLRCCMQPGQAVPTNSSTSHLKMPSTPQLPSSTSIMKKLRTQMHTFWPCVRHLIWGCLLNNIPVVLHPERKMHHFDKNWDKELREDVLELGREAVCWCGCCRQCINFTNWQFRNCYDQLQVSNSMSSKASTMHPIKRQRTQGLLRDTDLDSGGDNNFSTSEFSSDPWAVEFEQYISTNDIIPSGMTVVAWWGVRTVTFKYKYLLTCHLVKRTMLSNCKLFSSWLFGDYGIFGIKWTCLFISWPYNQ